MRWQERAGFRGRRFGGMPPLVNHCGGNHTLRRALQARHVLGVAQSAILARAVILVSVNQNKGQAQHQEEG